MNPLILRFSPPVSVTFEFSIAEVCVILVTVGTFIAGFTTGTDVGVGPEGQEVVVNVCAGLVLVEPAEFTANAL